MVEGPHSGRRLAKARGKLSQEKLAQRLDVSRNTIFMWESTGRLPYGKTVLGAARELQVSTDYLLGLTEDRRPVSAILDELTAATAAVAALRAAAESQQPPRAKAPKDRQRPSSKRPRER